MTNGSLERRRKNGTHENNDDDDRCRRRVKQKKKEKMKKKKPLNVEKEPFCTIQWYGDDTPTNAQSQDIHSQYAFNLWTIKAYIRVLEIGCAAAAAADAAAAALLSQNHMQTVQKTNQANILILHLSMSSLGCGTRSHRYYVCVHIHNVKYWYFE